MRVDSKVNDVITIAMTNVGILGYLLNEGNVVSDNSETVLSGVLQA